MSELVTRDSCTLSFEDTGTGPVLLFIHGWAMSGQVWRFQREELAVDHRVITLDLRGHGGSSLPAKGPTLDDLSADIATILEQLELNRVTLVAWSMGVQATLGAFPAIRERLASLILVGGTPRFTAGDGFPHALPPEEVRGMGLRLKRQYGRTMEEFFHGMFAAGEVDEEQYRRIVRETVKGGELPDPRVALRSLDALATADLRDTLPLVDRPTLLIHGLEDRICLPEASRFMAERIEGARLALLPGVGHAPFLSRPEQLNGLIRQFALTTRPHPRSASHQSPVTAPPHTPHPPPGIDRSRVRSSFDQHAGDYETYASVQRRVVGRLLTALERTTTPPSSVLDIGCGTGMLLAGVAQRFPHATLAGIDLAPAMVEATRSALAGHPGVRLLQGDAERLPFGDQSFDLVISTSTFQWLESLESAFSEAYRLLTPGGAFRFAFFGSRTLFELKESYRASLSRHGREGEDRTHRFLPPSAVTEALEKSGFSGIRVWAEDEVELHPDVPTLLRSLKKIGAGNASPGQGGSLAQRRVMLTMMRLYGERYGTEEGIPATYEVIYGRARRGDACVAPLP